MSEAPGDDRRLLPALADVARIEFDYADGEGIDLEPYVAFDSAEGTTHWLRQWTGNPELDGAAYRVFGQDGTGGHTSLWYGHPGLPLAEQRTRRSPHSPNATPPPRADRPRTSSRRPARPRRYPGARKACSQPSQARKT